MKAGIVVIGSFVAVACASPRSAETHTGSTRYRNAEEIFIAPPTGLALVMAGGRPVMPKFPVNQRGRKVEVWPVVAYVVDTTGAIESLAFLNSSPVEFRRAICEWSRMIRFKPLVVEGRFRRGLAVASFGFYGGDSPLPPAKSPDESRAWRAKLQEMSRAELYPLLESRPHC